MKSGVLIAMLLAFPLTAGAVGGSWSQTAAGGVISVGKQAVPGSRLAPSGSIPASATVTQISWRITLLSPQPPGLQIKLCTATACFALDSLSGQKRFTTAISAQGPFRFVYAVAHRGQVVPPVRVVSNQLTVNYR